MPRNITVTFADGSSHVYQNAPDDVTPDAVEARAAKEFGQKVTALDGGKAAKPIVSTEQEYTQPKPFGQQANEAISDIPRQIGLTARYGIEGLGNVADMVATPIRAAVNVIAPNSMQSRTGAGNKLADMIGLPSPQNDRERVIGEGAKMMAGGAVPIGVAGKMAEGTTGATNAIMKLLSANPGSQLASAGSSGVAGQYTKETGGNEGAQLLASVVGGVAAPLAISGANKAVNGAVRFAESLKPVAPIQQAQAAQMIDIRIDNALQPSGLTLDALPNSIKAGIRADVSEALKTNGVLSPDAVRRLVDYRMTGTTPTAGTLTLDPAMVSQQKNLQKLGINSKDQAAQQLGQVENANNRQLISGLNDMGANTPDTAIAGGRKIAAALGARNDRAASIIDDLYASARATNGRAAALDPHAFTQRAGDLLNEANVESFLTPDIRAKLNGFAKGDIPLNVDVAEQLKTSLYTIGKSSADGNVRKALSLVRQAIDETPLQQGQEIGQGSIDAFNNARRMNRVWMKIVERTPALQAVRDGMEPDKFVQQFIVGNGGKANVADLSALQRSVKSSPQAMDAVRSQITASLKKQALNGAADEVGNFSQSAYNKALNAIGDEKLNLFFTPEQVAQMKAIGRVASYEQFQPKGSAVNNSNTAGTLVAGLLDRIGASPLLSKIPFGNALQQPVQNISVGIKSQRALNPISALVGQRIAPKPNARMLLSPAAFVSRENQE